MANPLYGQNKADGLLDDLSNVKLKKFRIDAGVQAAGVATTENFAAGTIILTWTAKVTEAVTSDGSATVELGFTGTKSYSAGTIAKADLVADFIVVPLVTDSQPIALNAADTFDCKVATAALTAGKFDVNVWYIEPSACDSGDQEHVTA